MTNRFFKGLVAGLFAIASMTAQAESTNPYAMLQEVATITFDRIKREHEEIQKDPELLRKVMEEELLPHVDYKFSALKVLGKHYKIVPKEQFPEYISVFRSYLITTYALAMAYYNGQEVEFQPAREVTDETTVTVRAIVKEPGKPDINLAFKLRQNKKTDEWKAYDMVAEGISLLSTKQGEFESMLRKDGLDAVMDMMKQTINKPINLEAAKKV